jgi:hypothetical protein
MNRSRERHMARKHWISGAISLSLPVLAAYTSCQGQPWHGHLQTVELYGFFIPLPLS